MVRHTLKSLGPKVLATRMVRDYVAPALRARRRGTARALNADYAGAARARRLEAAGPRRLAGVRVEHVESSGVGDAPEVGADADRARVRRRSASSTPDDVDVQVVHGAIDSDDDARRHHGRAAARRPSPTRAAGTASTATVALDQLRAVRLHRPRGAAQRPARLAAELGVVALPA